MPADVAIQPVPELAETFARMTEKASRGAIAERGSFSMAIPGGSAVELLLPALIPAAIDWSRVELYWVDERMVPPEDPDSNYRLAKAVLLAHVPMAEEKIHRMRGEDPVPVTAAAAYARDLRSRLGDPARLDWVLLGVGPDGHVASLFPGHRLLRAWDRDVAVLEDAPKPPAKRMTLTLRALTRARGVVVFASGEGKASVVAEALTNDESELPVALATMGEGPVTFLLDPAAASKVSR